MQRMFHALVTAALLAAAPALAQTPGGPARVEEVGTPLVEDNVWHSSAFFSSLQHSAEASTLLMAG